MGPDDVKTADLGREEACGPGEGDAEFRLKGLARLDEPFICDGSMAGYIQDSSWATDAPVAYH